MRERGKEEKKKNKFADSILNASVLCKFSYID